MHPYEACAKAEERARLKIQTPPLVNSFPEKEKCPVNFQLLKEATSFVYRYILFVVERIF